MTDETRAEDTRSSEALTRADIPELVRLIAAEMKKAAKRDDPLEGPSGLQDSDPAPKGSPASKSLAHINLIGAQRGSSKEAQEGPSKASGPLSIGAGLPPVPQKLVSRIQVGEFVDMSELLPDRLGVNSGPPLDSDEDDRQKHKSKRRQVTSFLEWTQCFSVYMAVLTNVAPESTQDLLGYQALITEAKMEYTGDGWLGYDRRFRQRAAADPNAVWARIDPTLWNIAFAGQGRATRCKYCFSLTHLSDDCDWAPPPPKTPQQAKPVERMPGNNPHPRGPGRSGPPVCYEWNFSPDPICPHPGCRYLHICVYCSTDTHVFNKDHKALDDDAPSREPCMAASPEPNPSPTVTTHTSNCPEQADS